MKQAVILVNLGTPAAADKRSVRAFLCEFLSDPRVVEVPRLLWMMILYGIILPFRTPKVVEAYQEIWWPEGSPLRVITERQVDKLQAKLNILMPDNAPLVRYAMTYSGPSIESVINELETQGIESFLILPLYPQYSATTTGSIYDQVAAITTTRRNIPQIHIIKAYYDHPLYIEALAASVREHRLPHQRLLMSFHGIPQRNCDLGDPYEKQCHATAKALAAALGLDKKEWAISFQSRLGKAQWLTPYTIDVVKEWGQSSCESMSVVCPAFSVDCLETLEEIAVENRDVFIENGGREFQSIPCLNDRDDHIALMAALVEEFLPRAHKKHAS